MLQKFREAISGWIAWAIVIALIIPFSLWGINFYFGGGTTRTVLEIGKKKFTESDVLTTSKRLQERAQELTGNAIPTDSAILKKAAIEQIIEQELLRDFSEKNRLSISKKELAEQIRSLPNFHSADEKFDYALYQRQIEQNGMSVTGFEKMLRTNFLLAQMQGVIHGTAFIGNANVKNNLLLLMQERDFLFTTLPFSQGLTEVKINEADVESYYQQNLGNFVTPEKVRVSYISLSKSDIANSVSTSDETLNKYYEENKELYQSKEKRSFYQVRIREETPGKVPWEKDAAEDLAHEIAKKLEQSVVFEKLAESYSVNPVPGGRVEFSEIGLTDGKDLSEEIRSSLFKMSVSQVSEPLVTGNMIYVLLLKSIEKSVLLSFVEVRDQIENDYREQYAEKRFYEIGEEVAASAYEQPGELASIAATHKLPLMRSPWLSKEETLLDDPVFSNTKVLRVAFSEDVMERRLNSEPIEIKDGHVVVLQFSEHRPKKILPLSEVYQAAREETIRDAATSMMAEKGESLLTALRAGENPEALAVSNEFTWKTASHVNRGDDAYARAVLRLAFSAGQPGSEKSAVAGELLGNGDFILTVVTHVNNPEVDLGNSKEFQGVKSALLNEQINQEWDGLIRDLRANAEIKIK